MAELKKLSIEECTVSEDGKVTPGGATFSLLLNPSSFSHDYKINYTTSEGGGGKTAQGKSAPEAKFSSYGPETIKFDTTIDGTGVVPPNGAVNVREKIDALKAVVYTYEGTEHRPNVVQVVWGDFTFTCRLTSLSVNYTLFKPSGQPLRAKLSLSFTQYVSSEEEAAKADRQSPDLTHRVEVKAGDSLPLLCHRIYKDASYYVEIARVNDLIDFRSLEPGLRLRFPPLS